MSKFAYYAMLELGAFTFIVDGKECILSVEDPNSRSLDFTAKSDGKRYTFDRDALGEAREATTHDATEATTVEGETVSFRAFIPATTRVLDRFCDNVAYEFD